MDMYIALLVGLLLAGFILLLMEMMTPTFGILAMGAVAAFIAAVVVAARINSTLAAGVGVGVVVSMPLYWWLLIKFMPNSPLGRRLFLRDVNEQDTGTGATEALGLRELVGTQAVTDSVLRPSGAIRVGRRRVTAVAEHGMIDRGVTVRIVRISGMSVIVRPASPADAPQADPAPHAPPQMPPEGEGGQVTGP